MERENALLGQFTHFYLICLFALLSSFQIYSYDILDAI